jgi:predicted solute-binding protein
MVGRDSRARRERMLRVGCVKYLNARPLIRGWPRHVDFDHPSTLCKRLANGELDVAFVSSFEFLRNPIYRIVDDVSISSAGSVYSVVVAHRGDISEVDEIELDPAAETSVNLVRCLLAEANLAPHIIQRSADILSVRPAGTSPAVGESSGARRAWLLIGDQAIRFQQKHAGEFHFWDLGEQWNKLVGLPFVYALWLIRPEVVDSERIANRLRAVRDENLTSIDELIAEEKEFDRDFCRRYYRENLRFSFGEAEKKGLRTFAKLCAKQGLLSERDLVLDLV